MEVTETGTNTMPTPSPSDAAGEDVGGEVRAAAGGGERAGRGNGDEQPDGGDDARETWFSRCRRPGCRGDGERERQEREPVSSAEKPSTVCRKIEVRKTVPTRTPVTPSMTAVPETRALSFQMCGGNSGWAARSSSFRNATSRTAVRRTW